MVKKDFLSGASPAWQSMVKYKDEKYKDTQIF